MANSPLEQFEIIPLIPIELGSLNISFTNSSLYMFFVSAIIGLFLVLSTMNSTMVPNKWQSVAEMMYLFIHNTVSENVGPKGQRYFPLIFVVFIFILFSNLLGMVPYSFTITSHLIVTFVLAFSLLVGFTALGFMHHGLHFMSLFMPSGAPVVGAPFLVIIELISYIFRPLSLSIRLFANMMAGHTLLKIMSTFAWQMFAVGGILFVAGFVPLILIFAFTALEVAVAALQAYVFTVLVCIYLSDVIHLH